MKIITNSPYETIALGEKIGKAIGDNHVVVLLNGDLAAGKTTLTKGIAQALGVKEVIKSPTFTIMKEYEGINKKLYHIDLYRLQDVGMDFDLEEYVDDFNGVVVIEWPYQVSEILPQAFIKIDIKGNNESREFTFSCQGDLEEVIKKI
ncbi:MAG: tRNA (adenosine(37)-N6)-threonylcarbamoyltransferase complex ATPase subunit type 1 TsaE [Acholeplasma sp.]|nr:tRNA (adenosine(37)-N6)-threonylcarbamoyltransferase complex ATPase subunit type 1 TsaE [Acholeplasma sp.]